MEIIIRRRDIYVVAVALSLFFGWVAYANYDNHDMRESLRSLASTHVDEWFDSEPDGTRREDFDYMAIVDAERPYELFGPAFGVIHVYLRNKGDVDCETFKGVEYYYRREAGEWILEHSAGCAAKEHHVRAFQSYLDQGVGVEGHVIDQALGIEFDVATAEAYLKARAEGRNPFLDAHLASGEHDHEDGHTRAVHEQGAHDHSAHDHDAHDHGAHAGDHATGNDSTNAGESAP